MACYKGANLMPGEGNTRKKQPYTSKHGDLWATMSPLSLWHPGAVIGRETLTWPVQGLWEFANICWLPWRWRALWGTKYNNYELRSLIPLPGKWGLHGQEMCLWQAARSPGSFWDMKCLAQCPCMEWVRSSSTFARPGLSGAEAVTMGRLGRRLP